MKQIDSQAYKACIEEIFNIPFISRKTSMEDLRNFLGEIGHPEKTIPMIHVAGTNGKGSLSAMLANIYKEAGYKVGLFTSPHLIYLNERININGEMIANEALIELYEQVKGFVAMQEVILPTFFETVFIMALLHFSNQDVDLAIIETGIGGTFDCTNVIEQPLATAITQVGFDHEIILGDTLEAIANQKAGIIKTNCPIIYLDQNPIVNKVIEDEGRAKESPIYKVSDNSYKIRTKTLKTIDFSINTKYYNLMSLKLNSSASYHVAYGAIAVTIIEQLMDIFPVEDEGIVQGFKTFYWPGRMEILDHIVLDGAHNISGIINFISEISRLFPQTSYRVVFSAMKSKDYLSMIQALSKMPGLNQLILVCMNELRSCTTEDYQRVLDTLGLDVPIETSVEKAINRYNQIDNEIVCYVGSLHLIGQVKKIMGG